MVKQPLPRLKEKPRRELLAICGGGFAGLFAAEILRRLEVDIGKPLAQVFDLVAGTSVGGLLALGLAHGVPAEDLSDLLAEIGPDLFGYPRLGVLAPRHDRSELVRRVDALFSTSKLSDLKTSVVIPAVDLTAGRSVVFRNAPLDPTRSMLTRDAALATAAARVFLPPHAVDERLFVDGGLAANSPEAIAALDAVRRLGWPDDRTRLLVIGSTHTAARAPGHLIGVQWGASRWLRKQRLLGLAMRAQMTLARDVASALLGATNIDVIDAELTGEEEQVIGLDKATMKAAKTLRTLASTRYATFMAERAIRLDQWKVHQAGP